MLKKWGIFFIVATFTLMGCQSQVYNQAEANVADVKLRADAARAKSDASGKNPPPLVVRKGLYVDTTPIDLEREPSWLKNHIIIRGDALPFSYYSRTITTGAGGNILTRYQSGLDPAINVSMNYTGSLKGALDLLAAKTGYVYSIKKDSVYWQSFITRTFDIAFMPGSVDYLMGKTASGAGTANTSAPGGPGSNAQVSNYVSSDASESEFSNLKGTLSIWKDLEATVSQLLSPDGKVVVSESTTSVTVRDRPTNINLVSQYIANLNSSLSRQVLVKVTVLEVQLTNEFEFGINWQLIARAFNKSPFIINESFGTPISITQVSPLTTQTALPTPGAVAPALPQFGLQVQPNTGNPIPSYTILFNSLNQQGKTSIVTEPRVVCLNNQVSVVRIVNSQGYLASVQNTSLSGTTSGSSVVGTVTSQLTPGTLITGLTLYILPKIMKDHIYMQVNADLSTALPFGSASAGSASAGNLSSIQLPNVIEKHFNQRSMIRSGDTLILAGFRQLTNIANASQFLRSQAMGGKGAGEENTETVILITPFVLHGGA